MGFSELSNVVSVLSAVRPDAPTGVKNNLATTTKT
jgi:hypothetical protein